MGRVEAVVVPGERRRNKAGVRRRLISSSSFVFVEWTRRAQAEGVVAVGVGRWRGACEGMAVTTGCAWDGQRDNPSTDLLPLVAKTRIASRLWAVAFPSSCTSLPPTLTHPTRTGQAAPFQEKQPRPAAVAMSSSSVPGGGQQVPPPLRRPASAPDTAASHHHHHHPQTPVAAAGAPAPPPPPPLAPGQHPQQAHAAAGAPPPPSAAAAPSSSTLLSQAFYRRLMPFQKEGIAFGIQAQGRVLIADEMGLGR